MRALAPVLALLLTWTVACSSEPASPPTPSAEAPPSTAAPVPPRPDPRVGSCRVLTFAQAIRSVDARPAVGCNRPHTAVTFAVGQLDQLVDGHLVAMDSRQVSGQLDDKCARGLRDWVGGSSDDLRLSRFRAVWFRPDVAQADRGAAWFRCDVVAVAREGRLASFRGDLRGALDAGDALSTWGTCGTSNPAHQDFRKVICSQQHSWRAVSVVDLPRRTPYLGRAAAQAADDTCQDRATARTNESLRYEWAFQWPTREEWRSGQRYGWCWLPV